MALQFKEAIEKQPDGICMMGHPGFHILHSPVDEAVRKGILVTFLNVDIPELREKYVDKGMGYIGQNLYNSGHTLGMGSIGKFNLQKGDEAIIFGITFLPETGRGLRSKGCMDALTEQGIFVHLVEFKDANGNKPFSEETRNFVKETLEKYPNSDLIVTDHGNLTAAIGSLLSKMD
ncbi:MAG: hypothetical protein JW969_05445 [Spirochaetales bacterium]|nr:hypothetical protein [Spirochaetales bacterium]